MLQVTLNGNRTTQEHAQVPVTTRQLVEEAIQSVNAGADSIHFHARDEQGYETLEMLTVKEQVEALRNNLPQTPIGMSTGEWIEPDFNRRIHYIQQWEVFPDFVSINCGEARFEKVVEMILSKGIAWEAGISSVDAAVNFLLSGHSHTCFRLLIEPQVQELPEAIEIVERIEKIISKLLTTKQVLLHGFNHTCWPIFNLALEKNYATRIGLEDTLFLPDGTKALNNAALIHEARRLTENYQNKYNAGKSLS